MLYTIGDLHLSLGCDKPMDIFAGWSNYLERLETNWNGKITDDDTVVLLGDHSWALRLEESQKDLEYINSRLKGNKIFVKGNHDLWWSTMNKLNSFVKANRFDKISFLFNNAFLVDGMSICGTRGWFYEEDAAGTHTGKMLAREALRLEASFKAAGERPILCFLHYPPLYQGYECPEILALLKKYRVRSCFYGHLHGPVIRRRFEGERDGTSFSLISADYLGFVPKKICD